MRFNPGGNFFFVVDGKNVIIYNAYTLQRLHHIKATPEGVSDIVFGERDSCFAIITPDGFLGRYRLPNFTVIKEREANALSSTSGDTAGSQQYRSCDFIITA